MGPAVSTIWDYLGLFGISWDYLGLHSCLRSSELCPSGWLLVATVFWWVPQSTTSGGMARSLHPSRRCVFLTGRNFEQWTWIHLVSLWLACDWHLINTQCATL